MSMLTLAPRTSACVTEETLGRSAEGQHFSPFVDDDHRIGNSRQDGAKMRLAVAQSAFGRALVGNVADDDGKAADRSVQALQRRYRNVSEKFAAVLADAPVVHLYLDARNRLCTDRCRLSGGHGVIWIRSEEHTSELQSLMRISYAVFCLKK